MGLYKGIYTASSWENIIFVCSCKEFRSPVDDKQISFFRRCLGEFKMSCLAPHPIMTSQA